MCAVKLTRVVVALCQSLNGSNERLTDLLRLKRLVSVYECEETPELLKESLLVYLSDVFKGEVFNPSNCVALKIHQANLKAFSRKILKEQRD